MARERRRIEARQRRCRTTQGAETEESETTPAAGQTTMAEAGFPERARIQPMIYLPHQPHPVFFTDLAAVVRFAKLRCKRGVYDGRTDRRTMQLIRMCSHLYSINPEVSARLIYTRDAGHHSGGWWKNADYERCLHLSISFCVNPTDAPLPFEKREAKKIAEAFFEDDTRKCWVEPPYSPEGKRADVHHYRLFCDEGWNPIIPRGEVYTKDFTEAGWRSFSEIHGIAAKDVDAPWLKAASE